jgi:hypothetical protein
LEQKENHDHAVGYFHYCCELWNAWNAGQIQKSQGIRDNHENANPDCSNQSNGFLHPKRSSERQGEQPESNRVIPVNQSGEERRFTEEGL